MVDAPRVFSVVHCTGSTTVADSPSAQLYCDDPNRMHSVPDMAILVATVVNIRIPMVINKNHTRHVMTN